MNINWPKIIRDLIKQSPTNKSELHDWKRQWAKKLNQPLFSNSQILKAYYQFSVSEKIDPQIIKLLRKRAIRTLSGVAPIAVLTKPWLCSGQCRYCPQQDNVPTSYLSNEPAVMRAQHCHYDPIKQVNYRLRALLANGHQPNKIELIVIGGTWSYLPMKYQFWYITNCFAAANTYGQKPRRYHQNLSLKSLQSALLKEQKINESAEYRIIGLTLETRPDCINDQELQRFRQLGCTRVEIGVQAIDDQILKTNYRTADLASIIQATKLLRDWGFKITYHFMPALLGSSPQRDIEMYQELFTDSRWQPDQVKFYPTVVVKGSQLYQDWLNGLYHPYTDQKLIEVIKTCKKITPPYVRIIRLIRDIPEESIEAGNKITNLRQMIQQENIGCQCIRCREAGEQIVQLDQLQLIIRDYPASGGQEYFISWENQDQSKLFGFCRLRLPSAEAPNYLKGYAIVRELHVYGQLQPLGSPGQVQHHGLGRQLIEQAEKIAKDNNYDKIAVISGVGVRNYYRQLGYRLQKTYLVKKLSSLK